MIRTASSPLPSAWPLARGLLCLPGMVRERLFDEGPQSLSPVELLTVLVESAGRRARAPELAARMLSSGLGGLRRTHLPALLSTPGLGLVQACRVMAALELGRRAAHALPLDRKRLLHPGAIGERLWVRLAHLAHEEFWVLLLNARCEELRAQRISSGGLTHCSVLPREALAPAVLHGAPLCAFAHNHPSGDPTPSPDDLRLQLLLDEGARALGLTVVDHLVLADGGIHSARAGLLPPPPPPETDAE